LSYAILSLEGLIEVPVFCVGSRGYLLGQGSVLLNSCPLERLIAKWGCSECAACLA
jgi:hypothetical protein